MSVEPKSSTKEIPIQEQKDTWDEIKNGVESTPTMVFSVIGDSDSFVPRPWPTTLFQTALIEAAKSGGETWILFRKNKELVSKVILDAYQHYEAMEFGRKKDGTKIANPNRHIKLINISEIKTQSNSTEDTDKEDTVNCQVWDLNIGKEENQLLNFEKLISEKEVSFFNPKLEINMPVPIAIIVCEGDLRTVVHIAEALKSNIPVIIMKGSGKAADLVLDYIEKNDELRKKASISFGIQFDNEKYKLLETHLGEIVTHKNLIGVFDLDRDDPLKLSNIVGETVVSGWSMKHVILEQNTEQNNEKKEKNPPKKGSQEPPEYGPPLTGLSLTKRIWQKNSDEREDTMLEGSNMISRAHVLNPKYSTPTSLPLYFYFVYQVLQESDELGQLGPTLLLEALKANRCDYVRMLLAKGVKFEKHDLPELYRLTVACQGCKKDPPCLHMHWILKQLDKDDTDIIFGKEKDKQVEQGETDETDKKEENGEKGKKDKKEEKGKRDKKREKDKKKEKGEKDEKDKKGETDKESEQKVDDAAKALCRTILRYEECNQCGKRL